MCLKNGLRRYTFNSCTINNSNFEATVIIIVWNRLNGIERNKYLKKNISNSFYRKEKY